MPVTYGSFRRLNDRCVPKFVSNNPNINDYIGAVAAVSETQDDFRFVPFAAVMP